MVIVSFKNIKINWLKRKWDDNWDIFWPVLTAYKGVIIIVLLDYICVNKSFYTLKVHL